jgi:antitoxin HigA-1
MDKMGITQKRLAEALGVSRLSVNEVVNRRRGLTADMALRLSKATSTSPQFWLRLQEAVDLFEARGRLDLAKVEVLRPMVSDPNL